MSRAGESSGAPDGTPPDFLVAGKRGRFRILTLEQRPKHYGHSPGRPDANQTAGLVAPAVEQPALITNGGSHGISLGGWLTKNQWCQRILYPGGLSSGPGETGPGRSAVPLSDPAVFFRAVGLVVFSSAQPPNKNRINRLMIFMGVGFWFLNVDWKMASAAGFSPAGAH